MVAIYCYILPVLGRCRRQKNGEFIPFPRGKAAVLLMGLLTSVVEFEKFTITKTCEWIYGTEQKSDSCGPPLLCDPFPWKDWRCGWEAELTNSSQ